MSYYAQPNVQYVTTGAPQATSYVTTGAPQTSSYAQNYWNGQQSQGAQLGASQVRTINLGTGYSAPVERQVTRTMTTGNATTRLEHTGNAVQYLQGNATTRDIPLNESQRVERVMVSPDSYVNHMGSRGTQRMHMDKQEIMMSEHEIVMPGETVVHPQAVNIEEEEVVMQPETRLSPREVIVQPHTVVQPQEVQVRPQVIVAKPKTVIEPEEVFLTPQTVIQPKGMVVRPQDIVVADEEIVVRTGKTTVHDLGTDVYKQDQDVDMGSRGLSVSYAPMIQGGMSHTKEVHNMGVSTVRNLRFEGYQTYDQNQPATRTISFNNNNVQNGNMVMMSGAPQQQQQYYTSSPQYQQNQYVYSNGHALDGQARY